MFSIRNSDELGFRSSVGEMEDNELEEGEAVTCHDDEFIDPDAAFSYIDEKLQDIIGHFRKDFEGEVSAESLGSKFGQYGSFLPTHPRSPAISSQHKSPLNPPNPTVSKSPYKLSPKKPPVSSGTASVTNRCAPFVDSNKFKSVIKGSDRKSLKVRIKLGPNNTLTRSNAAIYSGLGLDTSPSSSPEDSPEACQVLPLRARDAPGESPSIILQAMTSFSVPGGCLLSPLSAHLSQWTENEFSNNRKAGSRVESDAVPIKETEDYLENDKKFSLQKDRVTEEDNLEYKTNTSRKLKNKNASSSSLAEPNSLNMPLKSCSRKAISKAEKLTGGNSVKDFDKPSSPFDDVSKHTMPKKTSLPNSAEVADQVELKKTAKIASSKGKLISNSGLSEKEIKETNASRHIDALSNTQKEGNNMNRKIISKPAVEHKSSYASGSTAVEPSKPMSALKAVSCDRHAKTMLQRIDKNQESKIKQKRNYNDGTSKEPFQTNSSQKIPSYVMSDGKKKSSHSIGEDERSNASISCKLTKKRHLKPSVGNVDAQGVKNTQILSDKMPERKKNACIHPEPPESSAFDLDCNAASALTAPAVINDNWVCCDKCGEWRLLPYEQDPNNLPKEWLCKMQYWLPGLNKCYISQDVTTKAFNERFTVPAPAAEAGSDLNGQIGINPANNIQLSDLVLDQDTKTLSNIGMKKTGLSTLNANKSLKLKRKLLSDKCDSSSRFLGTNSSSKAVPCKSTNLNTDKNIHKLNEKLQSQGPYSDREKLAEKSSRVLKSNSKRECSQEEFKPPKKIKKEMSNTDYKLESVVACASSGLQMKTAGKIVRKNSDHTSKDLKCEIDGKPSAFVKKSIDTHLIGNHKDKPNYEKPDIHEYAAKKRKVKEWQESQQAQNETVTTTKKHTLYVKECSLEGEPVPQKKTKLSNFERGSSTNISNEKEGKSDGSTKNLLPTTAATSGSSKVSSSRERRRRMGSPVESVSSSPLRTLSANKFTIRSCKDMVNTDSCLMKNRNICPEGEVGSDQSGVQINKTDNSVSYIKTTEESLDGSFSKKEAKSHLLHGECGEINDIVDVEKDCNNSEGRHKLNIYNHSNGNSNHRNWNKDVDRTLKPDINCSIITEAHDSDCKKIDMYVKNNGRSYHNESFLSHELLKDDKKSDTLMSHQSALSIIDNKSENITINKKILSELIQASKDKCEAQSSGSQVVVHTPPNNDATNSHELMFTKQSQTPENPGEMHLNNNNSQKVNGRESGLVTAADAVIKNARGLKHTANHMKSDGKRHESIEFYFEAALQFLHGSFLMEPLNENATTYKESNQVIAMMNLYSDTAKLFEYCAHEYETFKEMSDVALAFKCVEVAYMKVAYYKHAAANKDRLELRTSLRTVLPGESPSSSASDVDNLNNNGAVDKIISAKAANSPQIAGNHIIAARHRPNYLRLLEYAEYSNRAFDAMIRYQNAISAASVGMEKDGVDRLVSVRQALDVNFNNIEKLLQFIRNSRVGQSLIT